LNDEEIDLPISFAQSMRSPSTTSPIVRRSWIAARAHKAMRAELQKQINRELDWIRASTTHLGLP
jgi:hypothetical protein